MAIHIRQSGSEFLDLIANPFQAQVQANSIYASIVWAFMVSGLLFTAFIFFRPKNTAIYAPRAKHADQKHAPPALGKELLAWAPQVRRVQEEALVQKIGLDAVVLLRFLRMLRNIFCCFTVLGLAVLIPINLVSGSSLYRGSNQVATLLKLTPQYIYGRRFWAYVILAYVFEIILCFFIWTNYTSILRLRRAYFNSPDYQASLHSRTLLVRHIPKDLRSDPGVVELVTAAKDTGEVPRAAVARNVKDLPLLIKEHDKTIMKLEAVLSKYLRNPNQLPSSRPTCKPFKSDKQQAHDRVDAIDYLSDRSQSLQMQIKSIRQTLENRNSMPYGFASYTHIEDAHATAFASRKSGPQGTEISLAPKPNDLIWLNLPMSKATRRNKIFWNGLWMVLLTIAFIPLNIMSSVFLADLSHIGLLWSGFQANLERHPVGWGIAQGILAPAFQLLIFMTLPSVFRRMYNRSGDASKTSRERHVTSRLYAFFVVNNLVVFSLFGSAFRFLAGVIQAQDENVWDAIRGQHPFTNVMAGLCNVSTFWLTYQMQQNLSAAVDISQLWPLIVRWFKRKFSHPTPRQLIALSAPQPFDYASYYNTYLFISTVGMVFGFLQPIIFPITAFYLIIELYFKRYMLQYMVFTKNESGGVFWRTLVNRLLFAIILANAVVALIVGAQGVGADFVENPSANASMLYAMIPLPIIIVVFKLALTRQFDTKMRYFSTTSAADVEKSTGSNGQHPHQKPRKDRVAVRFGHPALYKKLLAPMVLAESEHLLKEILHDDSHQAGGVGRSNTMRRGFRHTDSFGYSDVYVGEEHQNDNTTEPAPVPYEFVPESALDFENFKRREEFREAFGGEGAVYGRPEDAVTMSSASIGLGMGSRPGTPSTFTTLAGVDEEGGAEKGFFGHRDQYHREGSVDRGSPNRGESTHRFQQQEQYGNRSQNISGPGPSGPSAGRADVESPLLSGGDHDRDTSPGTRYRSAREGSFSPAPLELGLPTPTLEREDIFRAGDRAIRRKPI